MNPPEADKLWRKPAVKDLLDKVLKKKNLMWPKQILQRHTECGGTKERKKKEAVNLQ